jgi:hypothetical protein
MERMQYIPASQDILQKNTEILQSAHAGRISSREEIIQVHTLLQEEFISRGGLIRDVSVDEMIELSQNGGEIWRYKKNQQTLAAFTLTPLTGQLGNWWYINHGVVRNDLRHQGGQIMTDLLISCLSSPRTPERYLVISVVRKIFQRLGFSQVDLFDLNRIDGTMSQIIQKKLRPDIAVNLFIKI